MLKYLSPLILLLLLAGSQGFAELNLGAVSNTLLAESPTRYAENPVISVAQLNNWDVQYGFTFFNFMVIDGNYYGWYSARDAADAIYACYMTSSDGLTWTKPNLGLVTYGGNTNNNIVSADKWILSVRYFPERDADQRYIAAMYIASTGDKAALYKSADRTSWSLLKLIMNGADAPEETLEIKDIIQRESDDMWIAYCVTGHHTNRRKICALVSDTTDPAGTWSWASGYSNGIILTSTSEQNQKYHIRTEKVGDVYLHWVARMNNYDNAQNCGKDDGYFPYIELYQSTDGLEFTAVNTEWFPRGETDEWDDMLIYPSGDLITKNNQHYILYTGSGEDHNNCTDKVHYVGYVTIPCALASINQSGVSIKFQ